MIIALTGHRSEDCESEAIVREKIRRALSGATEPIEAVISGMANGVDLWGADEALSLGIPVWAARPWASHEPSAEDAELYAKVIREAERVIVLVESQEYPGPWAYQVRNQWMVNNSDVVFAYWNGKPSGGTYNCIMYAKGKLQEVVNIYES